MEVDLSLESVDSNVCSLSESTLTLYEQYLADLVFHYVEHMDWYEMGFVGTEDFMPETVDDVYNSNLYCMSWFYGGALPFDAFELEYEEWLSEQVLEALIDEQVYRST